MGIDEGGLLNRLCEVGHTGFLSFGTAVYVLNIRLF